MSGHLYVIELGPTVKIGRSTNPEQRLQQHATTAAAHGVLADRRWIGPPHVGIVAAEAELIRLCAAKASPIGREYFPMPFEAAVAEAESIDYDAFDAEQNAVIDRQIRFQADVIKWITASNYIDPAVVAGQFRALAASARDGDVAHLDAAFGSACQAKTTWPMVALTLALMGEGLDSTDIRQLADEAAK